MMKTRREFIATAGLAVIGAGCATSTTGGGPNWTTIGATIAGAAARLGTDARLKTHPEDRAKFEVAEQALAGLVKTQDYDPAKFAAVIQKLLPLYGEQGVVASTALVSIYSAAQGTWIDVSGKPAVRAVIESMRAGIAGALAANPATRSLALVRRVRV